MLGFSRAYRDQAQMAQDSATVLKSMAVGRAECHLLRLSASAWDGLSRARLLRTVGDRRLETPSHGNLGHSTARNDVRELKSMALGQANRGTRSGIEGMTTRRYPRHEAREA